ncbi:hypothetical protein D3C85_1179680 [compost metagenome]
MRRADQVSDTVLNGHARQCKRGLEVGRPVVYAREQMVVQVDHGGRRNLSSNSREAVLIGQIAWTLDGFHAGKALPGSRSSSRNFLGFGHVGGNALNAIQSLPGWVPISSWAELPIRLEQEGGAWYLLAEALRAYPSASSLAPEGPGSRRSCVVHNSPNPSFRRYHPFAVFTPASYCCSRSSRSNRRRCSRIAWLS